MSEKQRDYLRKLADADPEAINTLRQRRLEIAAVSMLPHLEKERVLTQPSERKELQMLDNFCTYCNEIVDTNDPLHYSEITSWVSGPKQDGAVLRTHTGRVAHSECIRFAIAGVDPGTELLF